MKKILTILVLSLLVGSTAYASVWQYGSYKERTLKAAECGIFGYRGTAQQNIALEKCLKPQQTKPGMLGYQVITGYRTTLPSSITFNATVIPVSSLQTKDGHTITSTDDVFPIFLDLEAGLNNEEIVMCTGVGNLRFTGCSRGLAFYGSSKPSIS